MKSTEDRFWVKVKKLDSGCWEWMATKNNQGYGQFWDEGRLVLAHRFTYLLNYSAIPQGLEIDHLCRNRCCVNPAHLELVTHSTNVRRGNGPEVARKGRGTRTQCPHGHPYDTQNTYITPEGWRHCRICCVQRNREYRLALKSRFGGE